MMMMMMMMSRQSDRRRNEAKCAPVNLRGLPVCVGESGERAKSCAWCCWVCWPQGHWWHGHKVPVGEKRLPPVPPAFWWTWTEQDWGWIRSQSRVEGRRWAGMTSHCVWQPDGLPLLPSFLLSISLPAPFPLPLCPPLSLFIPPSLLPLIHRWLVKLRLDLHKKEKQLWMLQITKRLITGMYLIWS